MDKQQICIIHGGTSYPSDEDFRADLAGMSVAYDRLLYAPSWKTWLAEHLPEYDVVLPSMPNKQNARYQDWSTYFSKIIPFLSPSATLVGHSLGGIFLAKYLSEHPPAQPFSSLVLIAAPYDDETSESLGDFTLSSAAGLEPAATTIHLLHSTDDPVVPIGEMHKYHDDLPESLVHLFNDKQHFKEETFPELVEIIKS